MGVLGLLVGVRKQNRLMISGQSKACFCQLDASFAYVRKENLSLQGVLRKLEGGQFAMSTLAKSMTYEIICRTRVA